MRRLRLCHVINDLPVGGAEMMLYKLLTRIDRAHWDVNVISLIGRGPMGEKIKELGIPVEALGMNRGMLSPGRLYRLNRLLCQKRPDVVQTWLYHANLLGGLAAKIARRDVPVVWNIRMNSLDVRIDKRSTFWTLKLGARLSTRLPARIVINSQAGRQAHKAVGYADSRMVVIPNGFDLNLFHPSREARQIVRREVGLADETPLVGAVGRYHPHKDYDNFVHAAARIARRMPEVHFLLCGKNLDPINDELRRTIQQHGLCERFHLLGRRNDIPTIQASLDVAVLSSSTEGFPNVVGEAMSCAVPCAVTDVGAAADIVGETGRVAPPRDSEALSRACIDLLQMPPDVREKLGARARRRIEQHYSIDRIVEIYTELWRGLARERHAGKRQVIRDAA